MAKKGRKNGNKKTKSEDSGSDLLQSISRETWSSIWGVLCFILTFFFLMAAFGRGGRVGEGLYTVFSYLFGIGFYLIPVVLLCLGYLSLDLRKGILLQFN